jgi:hypothetical protein
LWKRARTRPQRAVCKRRLRGCENVCLQVNHTMGMPAKVGPKRDRALARAGCYFDGSAATCGVRRVLDVRESDNGVRGFTIVMLAHAAGQYAAASRRHCERSEAIHLSAREVTMDCFAALAMTAEVARSLYPPRRKSVALRSVDKVKPAYHSKARSAREGGHGAVRLCLPYELSHRHVCLTCACGRER